MIELMLRALNKLVFLGDKAATRARIRALNRLGHKFSEKAIYGKRLEIHAFEPSTITIEDGVEINNDTWLITHPGKTMTVREGAFISQHCTISGDVEIGKNSLIAGYVTIIDSHHVFERTDIPITDQGGKSAPIVIGEDVWIGASSIVLAGVTISDHCVVGANSTVTEDLPPWSIAVGNPAKVIKSRTEA